jgi:MinD-like ATPase involved in chromosome partitioning or flagellar assembly
MDEKGRIVTFYSYKGGVGRTFILASVAVTLAEWGRKVLCLDWDLEAPGLAHYFGPWLPELRSGLIDITEELRSGGAPQPNWRHHVVSVDMPGQSALDLLPAGSAPNYTERLQQVDWESLYDESGLGPFLESMREEMAAEYDVVLIDSRTGVTDAGGICTVQLPDMLVMVLTANAQSLEGTLDIGTRIAAARDALPFDRLRLPVLPLLSRFDGREERHLGEEWVIRVSGRLAPLYQPWLPVGVEPRQVLERTMVPYVSYWSFGEGIPAFEERASSPEMVSWSLETVAALIINGLGDVATLLSSRDVFVSSARLQKAQEALIYDIYLSCSRRDITIGRALAQRLGEAGVSVWFEADAVSSGGTWTDQLQRGLASSRHLVVLVADQLGKAQEQEVRQFLLGLVDRTAESRVLSVIAERAPRHLPPALANFPIVELTDSIGSTVSEILEILQMQQGDSPSTTFSTIVPTSIPTTTTLARPTTTTSTLAPPTTSTSPSTRPPERTPQRRLTEGGREGDNVYLDSGSSHSSMRMDRSVDCPVCGLRVDGDIGFLRHLEREHGAKALADFPPPPGKGVDLVVWAIQQTIHRPPIPLSAEQLRYLDSRTERLVALIITNQYDLAVFDLIHNTVLSRREAERVVEAIRRKLASQG